MSRGTAIGPLVTTKTLSAAPLRVALGDAIDFLLHGQASAFLQPTEGVEKSLAIIETSEQLVSTAGWNKFVYGANGYGLFDFSIMLRASARTVVVVHAGLKDDFFRSKLLKDDIVAVRNSYFPASNKREIIDHIRLGKDHWPIPPFSYSLDYQNFLTNRKDWWGCHAILRRLATQALDARKMPLYVGRTINQNPVLKTKAGDYVVFTTGDNNDGDYSHLEQLLHEMAKSNAPIEAKRAIAVWKIKNDFEPKSLRATIVSRVWRDSFTTPLLPFSKAERRNVLKSNSPNSRSLSAK
jgi:hypothetical protein